MNAAANAVNFTTNQGINPGDAGGVVNITSIDVANKRISGTFAFRVFRQMDGAQKTLTLSYFKYLWCRTYWSGILYSRILFRLNNRTLL